ncbi:ribonuclease HII [Yunchengibacter salinarum]|uniref:ribonuclease HII n=1 Tax=Yunchengibacter salinarum TaxID=3133399 RepID=UPI0035B625A9
MKKPTLFDHGLNAPSGPDFSLERAMMGRLSHSGAIHIAGVDEVGRGPLAGPVVAAAVILDPAHIPDGLMDSKKLTDRRRRDLAVHIRENALATAVAEASVAEIDQLNIRAASLLAMRRAVAALDPTPHGALVDGNADPALPCPTDLVIKGDGRAVSIAAASILAKIFRDDLMRDLATRWPHYGWERNAGYGVPAHLNALRLVGVSPHHRRSFAPIRQILDEENLPLD